MAEAITRSATPASLAAQPAARRRALWEKTVLSSDLTNKERLLALVLGHLAGDGGCLPAGGPQHAGALAERAHLQPKIVRLVLTQLELKGFISRPSIHSWHPRDLVRPITLTLPAPDPSEDGTT